MSPTTNAQVRARTRESLAKLPHIQQARAFLSSSAGKELAAALEREFIYGDMVGNSELETYFNLGAREVVLYLVRRSQLNDETGATT